MLARFSLLLFIFLLVMNPYSVVGGLGVYAAIFLVFYFLICGFKIRLNELLIFLILILLSLYGVFISFLNGIGQLEHFKVAVSLLVYYLVAQAIFFYARKSGVDLNELLLIVLISVVLNGFIILCEFVFPVFRDFIESFLIPSGNVDWTKGFRYRGLASGGGASLSVLSSVSFVLALYLYRERVIGFLSFTAFSFVLLGSLLLIGRSGLLLLPFAVFSFLFFLGWRSFLRFFVLGLSVALVFMMLFGYMYSALEDKYGAGFINYSFGFLLQGSEGIKSEGTVSMILEFLQVVPTGFPEVLTGFGFYGGSDFEPWTDSGYARMFLSIGFPAGVVFYIIFTYFVLKIGKMKPLLVFPVFFVLIIAEAKEPLLFSGYSARVFIFILVFIQMHYLAVAGQKVKAQSELRFQEVGGQN